MEDSRCESNPCCKLSDAGYHLLVGVWCLSLWQLIVGQKLLLLSHQKAGKHSSCSQKECRLSQCHPLHATGWSRHNSIPKA